MISRHIEEIKVLLFTLPISNNKEFKAIVNKNVSDIKNVNLIELFNDIYGMNKYTNYDMYLILSIFSRYLRHADIKSLNILLDKIVSLRFTSLEKDTDLVILIYFEVINKIEKYMDESQKTEIFSRFIYVLNNNIVQKYSFPSLYKQFSAFISSNIHFLNYSIKLGMLKEFCGHDEFVLDFYDKLEEGDIIDAALFSNANIRLYILEKTRSKYLLQILYEILPPWYVTSISDNVIPYFYFSFDVYGVLDQISKKIFSSLSFEDVCKCLKNDLIREDDTDDSKENTIESKGECHIQDICLGCEVLKNTEIKMNREELRTAVTEFNITLDISRLINIFGLEESFLFLRHFKFFDLKNFGEFICKAKNEELLKSFTQTFEFCDMTIVEALRLYFSSFFLVCESQIIHKVLEFFAEKYFLDNAGKSTFMDIQNDEKTKEFLFMFSYSLIALNTKIHNPNIKQKPTFKDYISDFTEEEVPPSFSQSYLESQYTSIKNQKIELASKNKPGKHDYFVFKKILERYDIPVNMPDCLNICKNCIIHSYKTLFSESCNSFMRAKPKTFFEICQILDDVNSIEKYLECHKDDTYRFLSMFKFYLSYDGKQNLYDLFIHILRRIEKPKVNVFSEIKNTIMKAHHSHFDIKDSILPQYKSIYSDIATTEIKNIDMVLQALKRTTNSFVITLVLGILTHNIDKISDLSILSDENILPLLDQCISTNKRKKFVEISNYVSDMCLLKYYKNILETNPRFINRDLVERFKSINLYNQDSFFCAIYFQKEFDMFDYIVTILKENIECRALNPALEENDSFFIIDLDVDFGQLSQKAFGEKGKNLNKQDTSAINAVNPETNDTARDLEDFNDNNKLDKETLESDTREKVVIETLNSLNIDKNKNNNGDQIKDLLYLMIDNNKETLCCFNVSEKYKDILNKPTSLFHFYSSSKSILNQNKAKAIHKNGCPLDSDIFKPSKMDKRLIYMIRKCDTIENKDILNYTLWIINLISSSLPLFCMFFYNNFGILLMLKNTKITNSIIKIFCSRLIKSLSGTPLCCSCGYNSFDYIDLLIKRLIKYDLVAIEDFEFYFSKRVVMIKNGEMYVKEGKLYIKNQ